MKDVQFVDYNSAYYTGPAIKLGAGVQVEEAYEAAHHRNSLVVGGDCATVGVVGGYLQGVFILIQLGDAVVAHTIQAAATPH